MNTISTINMDNKERVRLKQHTLIDPNVLERASDVLFPAFGTQRRERATQG
jgi:hypothetical protein